MLTVNDLSKRFGDLVAVDHVSFEINAGEIFGFLGPNGAGKTTTINMICSLLQPDSGSVMLDGEELLPNRPALRKHLGIVPQEVALYEELNALDNLKFWGGLYNLSGRALQKRIDELLDLMGLRDRAKSPIKTYSGGMKRRLNMAAGMMHQPKLLLLDEPTVGIDPQARFNMLETVRHIAESGTTILYTSHYLDEVEKLCPRLAIIDHGRILAMGTQESVREIVGEKTLVRLGNIPLELDTSPLLNQFDGIAVETQQDDVLVLSIPADVQTGLVIEAMIELGWSMSNLQIKEPSLDSVFIKLTGRELRD